MSVKSVSYRTALFRNVHPLFSKRSNDNLVFKRTEEDKISALEIAGIYTAKKIQEKQEKFDSIR